MSREPASVQQRRRQEPLVGGLPPPVATSRTVKESRWKEGNEPPEEAKRHSAAAKIVAIRTGDPTVDDETLLQGFDVPASAPALPDDR